MLQKGKKKPEDEDQSTSGGSNKIHIANVEGSLNCWSEVMENETCGDAAEGGTKEDLMLKIGGNYKRPKSKIAIWGIGVVLRG